MQVSFLQSLSERNLFMQAHLRCVSGTVSHVACFVSCGFDKELENLAAGTAVAECVNLKRKPNRQMLQAPVTFPGTMQTT